MKKKVVLLTLLMITAIGVNAQRIIADNVDANGNRHILTTYSVIYTSLGPEIRMSLSCIANSADTAFYIPLLLVNYSSIGEGQKMLIKLSDGSVITLENIQSGSDNYMSALYHVRTEDLSRIITEGVVKIRIETIRGNFDKDIRSDKMSKVLKSSMNKILKTLAETNDF